MKKYLFIVGLPVVFILLIGATWVYTAIEPITTCDPIGNARPLCGWQNPEDMAVLPDDHHVIVSEYGRLDGTITGALSLLDLRTETRQELYRSGSTKGAGPWGASDCLNAPGDEFSPHGIHFSQRGDRQMQLLVVQHGGRESVEMFKVIQSPDGWRLEWRGCVIAPVGSMLNDVVATPGGGFLVTNMATKRDGMLAQIFQYMKDSLFGVKSGFVLAWQPDQGFERLASSEGLAANGIEISPDGETIYVNYSMNGELRRINLREDKVEASITSLPALDNTTWDHTGSAPGGQLLVAGLLMDSLGIMRCMNLKSGTCPGEFVILAVDPETLESKTIYQGGLNTPIGGGTVGLRVNDGSLILGTFAGDRLVRVLPE